MKLSLLLFCTVLALAPASVAAEPPVTSAQVVAWATQMRPVWENLYNESRRKGARPVPVPPEVDPPCRLCGDTSKSQNELQVDAWVEQAMKPESDQIAQILQISKQAEQYRNTKGLSDAAYSALGYLPNEESGIQAAAELTYRYLSYRAFPMADQYDRQPKRAYAGISLLMTAAKAHALLGANDQMDQQAIQYANRWLWSVEDKIKADILDGKQYNLCPVYMSIMKSLAITGSSINLDNAEFEKLKKLMDSMDKLLHFKVNFTLTADATGEQQSHIHTAWNGSGKIYIKLDEANACYTPQWEGPMNVQVTNWDIVGEDGTPVLLVSPRNFTVQPKAPILNLCDANSVLLVPFNFPQLPREVISAKGHEAPGGFFSGFLAGVVSANNVNSAANAYTGRNGMGPATGGMANTIASNDDPVSQLKAHQGDTAFLMSPQGQALIKQLQQQQAGVMNQYRGQIAARNNAAGDANSPSAAVDAFQSAQMHWKNGSAAVASENWHITKDSTSIKLEMQVNNAPQQ